MNLKSSNLSLVLNKIYPTDGTDDFWKLNAQNVVKRLVLEVKPDIEKLSIEEIEKEIYYIISILKVWAGSLSQYERRTIKTALTKEILNIKPKKDNL